VAAAGLALAIVLGAGACSSAPAAPSPTSSGTVVTVSETEFSITLSQTTFSPGVYTFQVTDDGSFSHNLHIAGPGVDGVATDNLGIGQTASVTVELEAGTYELWCSIDSHRDKGMDVTITVS
jgi:plastocyanin